MPEEQIGVAQNTVEEQTIVADSPAAEEVTQTPVATPQGELSAVQEEMPQDQAKQREAFIAMRQQIKQLEAEKRQLGSTGIATPAYDPFQPSALTAEADVDTVIQSVNQAKKLATQAMAQSALNAAQQEDMEAYRAFPSLDPSSQSFNKDFEEDVAAYYAKLRLEGKNVRVVDVAQKLSSRLEKVKAQVATEAQAQAEEKLSQKEQASLEARGSSANVDRQPVDSGALRKKAVTGDVSSLAEILKQGELKDLTIE